MPESLVENVIPESDMTGAMTLSAPAQLSGVAMPEFTRRPFPRLFEDQVQLHHSRVAVTCEAETLTFDELNTRANQLARHLRKLGAGRESLVGICIDRSLDMAVGILGVLKAGAAYLPLDPEYPRERLDFMIADSRPHIILTKSTLRAALPETDSRILELDHDWQAISQAEGTDLTEGPSPEDLAYVIYTSGSTGQPKGVMIEHANLANYLLALNHELQITSDDLYLHLASIAFSSSRRQLMLPLSQGATVVIASSDERKDPLALFQMIKSRGVTVMDSVPSFWRNCTTILAGLEDNQRRDLLDNKLRLMLSASEPLLSDVPRTWTSQFKHPARHIHMFGQTETAGIVSVYHLPESIDEQVSVVPVGRPIANSAIYILDEEQKPCPRGVAGELYIGGAGVGRGYLNRPDLTAEKFVAHPFDRQAGARLYRTGDWARCNADGEIEFTGRRDQQVKLRGFRIELGEVEAAISQHPAVRESAVIARADDHGNKKLIAFIVTSGPSVNAGELREFLANRLPDYAVPAAFVELEALPLSQNGKVDRLALSAKDDHPANLSSPYHAPRNTTEERLAAIWSAVLGLERVGINDNFFEVGGHSLLAAQIVARVRREFGVDVPLRVLFESPTIAQMAGPMIGGLAYSDSTSHSIQSTKRNGKAPLSFTQQQFWLLGQAEPDGASYNVRTAIRINGDLKVESLRLALDTLVDRHEILRTNIVVEEGDPVQIISPSMKIALDVADLSHLPEDARERETQIALAAEAAQPFDLSQGPLLRTRLMQLDQGQHVLILTIHHIICDGWSVGVLLRELVALYERFSQGEPASLPPLAIQYADFALWQRTQLQDETLGTSLRYWKQQLAGASPKLDIPTDFPRTEVPTLNGAQASIQLPRSISEAVKTLSRREGATLFMTLLAAFQTLLFRYGGQEDIVVGSPVAGRTMLETEGLIGAFVNTLVLRGQLSGNPTFSDFLASIRETTLGAFSHQDLPFEKLVQELNPERSFNSSPVFQVMFALQNSPTSDLKARGLTLEPVKLKSATSKFDLSLEVEEDIDGLCVSCEYNAALFASETIERMLGHFQNLLSAITANPMQRVAELPLLSEPERHKLLVEWNDTREDFADGYCIHPLFEAQVEKTPEDIAVEFEGQKLTYAELNGRANRLAHYLQKQSVEPEVMVGICFDRSLEMLVAMLGVLKAGGAYVPLDPAYPKERLAFMIADAELSLVLTQAHLAANISDAAARLVRLDEDWETIAQEPAQNLLHTARPEHLAYVIYTSGSTGNPKGVMIEHRSLVNFSETAAEAYSIKRGDRVLQFASICFDLSVEEIYPALTHGATVVLRTAAMISSARDFLRCCDEWNLTVLDLPTAYWHDLTLALSEEKLSLPNQIRLVIIGGEKASLDRVNAWHQVTTDSVRLVNTYGPTEATVVATMCDLPKPRDTRALNLVSIGRPLRNTTAFVLDKFQQPVPIGVAGELYIGGPGVARGYINRPELTAEKFISDPFSPSAAARLYKTGDLVRYLRNGDIEFLGRVDNQIKIRGFRVELEEIEEALRSHADVNECVVVLHEAADGDKSLLAYLVPHSGARPTSSELRKFLKAKLPSYMVPAMFELLDVFPLMPNGKLDRRALPEPQPARPDLDETFVAPSTPLEELLAGAWKNVLKLAQVGVHDNFFELGGHSLLAARVVANLRRTLDVELNMVDIFRTPTISGLAAMLAAPATAGETESELAALFEEMARLTDEEAQLCFEQEMGKGEGVAA